MGEDEVGLQSKAPRSARWKLWSVTGSLISFENNWWKLVFNAFTWMRESRLLKMSFSQHFSDNNLILRIFRSGVPGVSKLVRTWESQLVRNLIFSNAQEIPSGRDEFWKEIFKNCNKKKLWIFCEHRAAPGEQANKRTYFSNDPQLIDFDQNQKPSRNLNKLTKLGRCDRETIELANKSNDSIVRTAERASLSK